jgi:hypothetical protein
VGERPRSEHGSPWRHDQGRDLREARPARPGSGHRVLPPGDRSSHRHERWAGRLPACRRQRGGEDRPGSRDFRCRSLPTAGAPTPSSAPRHRVLERRHGAGE